jgi:hypothetical protein
MLQILRGGKRAKPEAPMIGNRSGAANTGGAHFCEGDLLADGGGGHVLHWTVSDEGDRFRKQAEDCRQKAERAVSPHDRDFWLRLAADWTKLAQSAEDRHRF